MSVLVLFLFLSAMQFGRMSMTHVPVKHEVYTRPGDLMLGGLFPLHDEDCWTLRELETLHRMEAMAYAVELVNNMTGPNDILPNITLGFEIYDTCSSEPVTLSNGLRFVRYLDIRDWHCEIRDYHNDGGSGIHVGGNFTASDHVPVIGVIGTESSSTTIAVDQMYGVFHLPLVSYFATSDDLSNSNRFPYFARVVPPDTLQVQAIVDILIRFEWSYVTFVYSDDSYGRNAIKYFKKLIKYLPICLAWEFEIESDFENSYFDFMIETIMSNKNARVVILFAQIADANNFLSAMNRTNAIGKLQLIGSDGWGMSISEIEPENFAAADGSIKTHLSDEIVYDFERYFRRLNITNRRSNPWFAEFWYRYLNCSQQLSKLPCLNAYRKGFSEESGVSRVIDSVLTYAHALNALLRNKCPKLRPICVKAARNVNNTLLFSYIKTVNFTGFTGRISFDNQGDMRGMYEIENIHCSNQSYNCTLVLVGNWNSLEDGQEKLTIKEAKIKWGVKSTGEIRLMEVIPRSYCSDPCQLGQATIHHGDGCCWSCSNCSGNSITRNKTVCEECGSFYAPNDARDTCVKIVPSYTKWTDPYAVVIVTVDCVGLICACCVLFCYVMNNSHPLIKASSRELSYMMLVGVFLSYLLVFSFIAKPCPVSCFIIRIGYMMCFTITYAPILTRANRIYRIFKAGKRSTKRPGCISPHSQVFIASGIVMVQGGINLVFLLKTPPQANEEAIDGQVELTCKTDHVELVVSLSYNLTIIILCSAHAFMTRKVPTNYNESRFISLSVYTTLVIWLAFIPCYFIVPFSHLQVIVMSSAMIVSATVSLTFMYVPKLYAVYFVRDVDVHVGTYRESRSVDDTTIDHRGHSITVFGRNVKFPLRSVATVAPEPTKPIKPEVNVPPALGANETGPIEGVVVNCSPNLQETDRGKE